MYAYAHNSQRLSELNVPPHSIVFHKRPRMPLTFDLKLNRNTTKTCISKNCSQLPEHSHFDKTDLNPFFNETLSKLYSTVVPRSRNCKVTNLFYSV